MIFFLFLWNLFYWQYFRIGCDIFLKIFLHIPSQNWPKSWAPKDCIPFWPKIWTFKNQDFSGYIKSFHTIFFFPIGYFSIFYLIRLTSKNDTQKFIQKMCVSKILLNFFALLRKLSPGKPSSGAVRDMGPMSNENIDYYL